VAVCKYDRRAADSGTASDGSAVAERVRARQHAGAETTDALVAQLQAMQDTEQRLLRLVERVLSRRPGVRLISAMRPQLGLDLAADHHPDLVLLDLHLPDMPGEAVLRRLQASPRTAGIPVVILSADARPGLVQRLLEQGARGFLTKPLDVPRFLDVIDGILVAARP
jgi:CheY-like chemotaxis protein